MGWRPSATGMWYVCKLHHGCSCALALRFSQFICGNWCNSRSNIVCQLGDGRMVESRLWTFSVDFVMFQRKFVATRRWIRVGSQWYLCGDACRESGSRNTGSSMKTLSLYGDVCRESGSRNTGTSMKTLSLFDDVCRESGSRNTGSSMKTLSLFDDVCEESGSRNTGSSMKTLSLFDDVCRESGSRNTGSSMKTLSLLTRSSKSKVKLHVVDWC